MKQNSEIIQKFINEKAYHLFPKIDNPTEQMCMDALKFDLKYIQYIKNPTFDMWMYIWEITRDMIQFLKLNPNHDYNFANLMILQNYKCFLYINNNIKDEKMCDIYFEKIMKNEKTTFNPQIYSYPYTRFSEECDCVIEDIKAVYKPTDLLEMSDKNFRKYINNLTSLFDAIPDKYKKEEYYNRLIEKGFYNISIFTDNTLSKLTKNFFDKYYELIVKYMTTNYEDVMKIPQYIVYFFERIPEQYKSQKMFCDIINIDPEARYLFLAHSKPFFKNLCLTAFSKTPDSIESLFLLKKKPSLDIFKLGWEKANYSILYFIKYSNLVVQDNYEKLLSMLLDRIDIILKDKSIKSFKFDPLKKYWFEESNASNSIYLINFSSIYFLNVFNHLLRSGKEDCMDFFIEKKNECINGLAHKYQFDINNMNNHDKFYCHNYNYGRDDYDFYPDDFIPNPEKIDFIGEKNVKSCLISIYTNALNKGWKGQILKLNDSIYHLYEIYYIDYLSYAIALVETDNIEKAIQLVGGDYVYKIVKYKQRDYHYFFNQLVNNYSTIWELIIKKMMTKPNDFLQYFKFCNCDMRKVNNETFGQLQICAINHDINNYKYIKIHTCEIWTIIIRKIIANTSYIHLFGDCLYDKSFGKEYDNLFQELQLLAIDHDVNNYKYIRITTGEIWEKILNQNGLLLKDCPLISNVDFCIIAYRQNKKALIQMSFSNKIKVLTSGDQKSISRQTIIQPTISRLTISRQTISRQISPKN